MTQVHIRKNNGLVAVMTHGGDVLFDITPEEVEGFCQALRKVALEIQPKCPRCSGTGCCPACVEIQPKCSQCSGTGCCPICIGTGFDPWRRESEED